MAAGSCKTDYCNFDAHLDFHEGSEPKKAIISSNFPQSTISSNTSGVKTPCPVSANYLAIHFGLYRFFSSYCSSSTITGIFCRYKVYISPLIHLIPGRISRILCHSFCEYVKLIFSVPHPLSNWYYRFPITST